jgi:hypothetical protein
MDMRKLEIKILGANMVIKAIDEQLKLLHTKDLVKMEYLLFRKEFNQKKIKILEDEIQRLESRGI